MVSGCSAPAARQGDAGSRQRGLGCAPTAARMESAAVAGGSKPPDRPGSLRASAAVGAKSGPSAESSACTHLVTKTRTSQPSSLEMSS